MRHFRKWPSSSAKPVNSQSTAQTPRIASSGHSRTKDPKALTTSSGAISCNPSDDEADPSRGSRWRTAYETARLALDITKESSDMFLPLKAVVGALTVLIKNYDQTAANAEQIRDIEERIQSLAEVLASPMSDQDGEEKARRKALRKKLTRIIKKLKPLSEQRGLWRFLKNVDQAQTLSGFVQDLAYAVTDYQTSIQQNIHKTTKKIDENTRNIIEAAEHELLKELDPVRNAGHQAGHHDTCLRGTRQSVLNDIMRWAEDPQDMHVFWLNGLAGTGKSTIAQTFAGMVADGGTLGASFFCSRDYLDRKELKNIFPTLSYQLACRYPAFRTQIIPVIKRDPSVARNSLISQLKDLIVDPLSSTGISCVIIIDALDECVDDQPASAILSVLACFFKQLPSVKFIITGRPEPRIRAGFRLPLLEPSTQVFPLHQVGLSSVDEDIRLYLHEKLTAVAKRRSDFDLTDPWPCDKDLMTLTKKSSGLFIFASTLARFIESEHHEPNERLQLLVTPPESTIHEGRAGVDPLYIHILLSGFRDVKDDTVFANLRRVLGAVVLAFNPLSQMQVARILDIKRSLITSTLRHLHSVLLVPSEDSKELRFFHKSFPDFLQDPGRCPDSRFFISSPVYHADMALGCLKLLTGLKRNPCDLPDFVMNRDIPNIPELLEDKLGGALRYACAYWAMHVRSSTTDNDYTIRLIASVTGFFEKDALQWIEVMSLENRLEGVIHNINNLTDWLGTVNIPTSGLENPTRHYLRFTMHFFRLIQQSAQHIYHSALPLSPKSSIFYSMSSAENLTQFYGRPTHWGPIVRTIAGTPGGFTSMAIIGRGSTAKIVAARDDGTVGIYDSVAGVLKLSLRSLHPIQSMTGSPDGSVLFCTHLKNPSVTLWDIQTGVLVHTFSLTTEAKSTAVSLNGRYLACGLSSGTVNIWEVTDRMQRPAFENDSPITCLCWLVPEERLMVANEASVHVRDIVTGNILFKLHMRDPVYGAAYSQKSNQLAIAANSGSWSFITIIDAQTGAFSDSYRFRRQSPCFTFFQNTKGVVCGGGTPGLEFVNASMGPRTRFDFPATVTSVSTLSSGIVVVNVPGAGIQLLSPSERYSGHRLDTLRALTVRSLDKGRIIAVVMANRDCVVLVQVTNMDRILKIPAPKGLSIPTDRVVVLCASLEKEIAVHCFAEGGKDYLQLWKLVEGAPKWTEWTIEIDKPPSAGAISPAGSRLVTFRNARSTSYLRILDVYDGTRLAELDVNCPSPLDITFHSENRFSFHYDTHHVPYDLTASLHSPPHSIIRGEQLPLVGAGQAQKRQYCVDNDHEWVVDGSRKICWIPPGYIGPVEPSYCWVGSSLVMVGQDGTLRKLTFRELSS